MEKIQITAKYFLVEGGCNACGMLNSATYTLHFQDESQYAIEELSPVALVRGLAIKKGWREAVEPVGIGEEAVFLKKGPQAVELSEDSFKTSFKARGKSIPVLKKECTLEEVFEKSNEILTDLFELPSYDFALIED